MRRRRILILSIACLFSIVALGQNVKVRGKFLVDSVKIGEQIPYSLTARYPKSHDVVFPDSAFSFAPFEFQKKTFFTTVTKDSISYDSVVYFLATYEIDSIQSLSLPVFLIQPHDSSAVYAFADSLKLIEVVASVPDSVTTEKLPLKTNTAYQKVQWLLNYPILLLIAGVLIILVIIAWLIFGKRIRRYYALRRLQKKHLTFISTFNALLGQLKTSLSSPKAEEALSVWKKYMEGLASRPYTKFTSKEIIHLEKDEKLGFALHSMDRLIYGGVPDLADESFGTLLAYTEQQYHKKMEELKNG